MPDSKPRTLVEKACAATSASLASLIPDAQPAASRPPLSVSVYHARELQPPQRVELFALYESNMRSLSEGSSMGWDTREKKKELFHRDSRFIIVRSGEETRALMGFAMFRFDWEECVDDDRQGEIEVLYCYELQLAPSARRLGLGRALVQHLETLARKWKMKKIMLTCLISNEGAMAFYKSQGFIIDAISPSQFSDDDDDEEVCDYEIMSKLVPASSPSTRQR